MYPSKDKKAMRDNDLPKTNSADGNERSKNPPGVFTPPEDELSPAQLG